MKNRKQLSQPTFYVRGVGPIAEAEVKFGTLTVLVGPQATGKTLFLETLKLTLDRVHILRKLKTVYDISTLTREEVLDLFYGQGLGKSINGFESRLENSRINNSVDIKSSKGKGEEKVYYIPAQRSLLFRDGFPRPFSEFGPEDPYVVRAFSDRIRTYLHHTLAQKRLTLFPHEGKLQKALRSSIEQHLTRRAKLTVESEDYQRRRLMLSIKGSRLPYMTWSTGQREFLPLLLGLYWLLPSGKKSTRAPIQWVIIEEPEMGLHPRALQSVALLTLELIKRGYRVVLSTHSSYFLEMIWMLNHLQELAPSDGGKYLARAWDIQQSSTYFKSLWKEIQRAHFKAYYFRPDPDSLDVQIVPIPTVHPNTTETEVEEDSFDWGELYSFTDRANDIVATLTAQRK